MFDLSARRNDSYPDCVDLRFRSEETEIIIEKMNTEALVALAKAILEIVLDTAEETLQ